METLQQVMHGFAVALEPCNVLFLFFGTLLGTITGMLPGIGPAAGIAILLPLTFGLDPVQSLIMLAGIYYGSMYGNTASAVLINTPGTASAAMTTIDGYPMARNGRAGAALSAAAIAYFVAGTMGILALTVLAVPFSVFALRFGPAEYFILMLFSLSAVSSLTGGSIARGAFSALLGLMIGTIGMDLQTGTPRYVFGVAEFRSGVSLIVVIVGMFAVAETLLNVERWMMGRLEPIRVEGSVWMTPQEWRRIWAPISRGGRIGFLLGVLPGVSGAIATVVAYATEKKVSKHAADFGKGAIEGVAAPEAANNASTCGALVPLLTLGIPGSGTTAVLLAAFILYGFEPGADLFHTHPEMVWGLIDSMYLGNVFLIIMNLPLIGLFVRILYLPPGLLMGLILAVSTVGVYSLAGSTIDLFLMLFFGILGYAFRKLNTPIPPLILGLVLGGLMEQSFRQALTISDGNPAVLAGSPICIVLLIMTVTAWLGPMLISLNRRVPQPLCGDG